MRFKPLTKIDEKNRIVRNRITIFLIVDIIIFTIFTFSFKTGDNSELIFVRQTLFLSLPIWILINYLNNRYHKYIKNITFANLIKRLSRLSLNYCILNLIIIVIINFYYIDLNFFTYSKKLLFISVISFLFEISINHFLNRSEAKKKYLFIGDLKKFEMLKSESSNKKIIDYLDNKDIKKINKLIKNYHILIVDNLSYLNEKQIKTLLDLKREGFLIMDIYQWCEKFLKRFPSFLFKEEILTKDYKVKANYARLKRLGDVFLSLLILIFSSPVLIFCSFLIILDDGFPIIYKQIRVGHYGNKFKIFKLRSMKNDSEKDGAQWSKRNDTRITRVGKFLRLSKIDELPQLLCVLKGEMSLIGPRPERPEFEELLDKQIPYYKLKHLIKPGLSGWAQVNYPYGASIKDSSYKLSYDLYYLKHRSVLLDLKIIFKTIKVILNSKKYLPK